MDGNKNQETKKVFNEIKCYGMGGLLRINVL